MSEDEYKLEIYYMGDNYEKMDGMDELERYIRMRYTEVEIINYNMVEKKNKMKMIEEQIRYKITYKFYINGEISFIKESNNMRKIGEEIREEIKKRIE